MKQVLLIVLVVVLTVGAMAAGAGIYKWTTSTPHPTPTPTLISTPTPEPNLVGLLGGLIQEYVSDLDVSDMDVKCITHDGRYGARTFVGFNAIKWSYMDGKWTIRNTGDDCAGIETWEIDDATGAITYLGSTTAP